LRKFLDRKRRVGDYFTQDEISFKKEKETITNSNIFGIGKNIVGGDKVLGNNIVAGEIEE